MGRSQTPRRLAQSPTPTRSVALRVSIITVRCLSSLLASGIRRLLIADPIHHAGQSDTDAVLLQDYHDFGCRWIETSSSVAPFAIIVKASTQNFDYFLGGLQVKIIEKTHKKFKLSSILILIIIRN